MASRTPVLGDVWLRRTNLSPVVVDEPERELAMAIVIRAVQDEINGGERRPHPGFWTCSMMRLTCEVAGLRLEKLLARLGYQSVRAGGDDVTVRP